ncbi:MAG: FixH family protein [Gammaproteobacteria bacterium]
MKAWYRHPWMWLIVGLPLVSVIGCLITIYLAYQNPDRPLANDIKRQGMFYKDAEQQ